LSSRSNGNLRGNLHGSAAVDLDLRGNGAALLRFHLPKVIKEGLAPDEFQNTNFDSLNLQANGNLVGMFTIVQQSTSTYAGTALLFPHAPPLEKTSKKIISRNLTGNTGGTRHETAAVAPNLHKTWHYSKSHITRARANLHEKV
jgi:hypothetical protein